MQKSRTRIFSFFLFLTSLLVLAGCGGGDSGSDDTDFASEVASQNQPVFPGSQRPLLIAQFDSYEGTVDTILQVDELFGILSNDEYPVFATTIEYPSFTVQGGALEVFSGGAFEYEPPAGFVGEDSFTYTIVSDDDGRRSSAQVFINIFTVLPRKRN